MITYESERMQMLSYDVCTHTDHGLTVRSSTRADHTHKKHNELRFIRGHAFNNMLAC